ncbi:MAG TPA: CBS domain-containing protein [Casimicrobiaceae bacterium]|nr:CBS domain-containing protein [Casimicrobiaceae bacterium]
MSFQSLRAVLAENHVAAKPSIAATATVSDAVALMKASNADAVVAMNDDRFVGVFTAHDVLTQVVASARDAATTRIVDALSDASPRVDIDATIARALVLMDERRCDHVTVSDDGRVLGVLSRGDLNAWMIRNQQEQLDSAIRAVKFMGFSNRRP